MSPHTLAEELVRLSSEYSTMSEERAQIEQRRPFKWTELRADAKSVKDADVMYEMTDDGQRLIYLKRVMEGYEQRMSAIKNTLQTNIAEMRNLNTSYGRQEA